MSYNSVRVPWECPVAFLHENPVRPALRLQPDPPRPPASPPGPRESRWGAPPGRRASQCFGHCVAVFGVSCFPPWRTNSQQSGSVRFSFLSLPRVARACLLRVRAKARMGHRLLGRCPQGGGQCAGTAECTWLFSGRLWPSFSAQEVFSCSK